MQLSKQLSRQKSSQMEIISTEFQITLSQYILYIWENVSQKKEM